MQAAPTPTWYRSSALAAVVQSLGEASKSIAAEPVVAYSVSYPLGVLGLLAAMLLFLANCSSLSP